MAKDDRVGPERPVEAVATLANDEQSSAVQPGASRFGPGDRIGANYRLKRLLGHGGMGDVWLAYNETLEVDVAIKLVRPHTAEKDAAERLLREARAAARLGHPAIVRVFDFGQTDAGEPFIVMERLEGEDLATALGRLGRLKPQKAVKTLLPIAQALVAAHGKGIVHRDLKPENIFLAQMDGDRLQPKVVDFGIAQVDRAKGGVGYGLLGSPAYMAPEQARGGEVDHRADVWSFTVVLYEAIVGSRPFPGKTHDELVRQILSDSAVAQPPEITDAALWGVLAKGLEKDPGQRFASMRELGEALSVWLLDQGVNEDIGGAAVDAVWVSKIASGPGDGLGNTVRPVAAPGASTVVRGDTATLPQGAPAQDPTGAPARDPRKWIYLVAGVATLVGLCGGIVLVTPRKHGGGPAIPVVGSASPAGGARAPIPVEELDQIPIDGTGVGGQAATKAGERPTDPNGQKQRTHIRKRPHRSLKDPFAE